MPPLPNTLYTRDTTCWLYGGLTLNPLYWPARHDETLLMKAIYEFHPDFVGSTVWWGDPEREWGLATLEGGDVVPAGNGGVLGGVSERASPCCLYGGLPLNPLYWPPRHDETLLMKAIYEFHPDFVGSTVWWGDPEREWGLATLEGGDVMPAGNGVVLVGMSERSSRQAITQLAATLFERGAAERVIVAGMPKLRSAMHLDTVFTFADRDCVTTFPNIVDGIHTFTLRPGDPIEVTEEKLSFVDVVADALNLPKLRIVETGGDAYASERGQWDSGNNLVALEPGVVVAYDRNTHTNSELRKAG